MSVVIFVATIKVVFVFGVRSCTSSTQGLCQYFFNCVTNFFFSAARPLSLSIFVWHNWICCVCPIVITEQNYHRDKKKIQCRPTKMIYILLIGWKKRNADKNCMINSHVHLLSTTTTIESCAEILAIFLILHVLSATAGKEEYLSSKPASRASFSSNCDCIEYIT